MQPVDSRTSDNDYRSLERGIRALESKVPAGASQARTLFGALTGLSSRQRADRWVSSVNQGLEQLARERPALRIEGIYQNPVFHNVLSIASEYAADCQQAEKLVALRNAALNSTLSTAPEERAQIIYLKVIDILTPWHLRLLREFSHVSLVDASDLEAQLPDVAKQRRFYENLVSDLEGLGLVFVNRNERAARHIPDVPVVTDQGRRFLRYISSPLATG